MVLAIGTPIQSSTAMGFTTRGGHHTPSTHATTDGQGVALRERGTVRARPATPSDSAVHHCIG